MTMPWLAAALHLLALVIGAGSISVRASALRVVRDDTRLPTVFRADALWGLAAALWIGTGFWRVFGGFEKGSSYYFGSMAFSFKMLLLLAIIALEIRPMITLIRWRTAKKRGQPIDFAVAPQLARISFIQLGLVIVMVFAATAMARGLFS
jgi:putative membrane protein